MTWGIWLALLLASLAATNAVSAQGSKTIAPSATRGLSSGLGRALDGKKDERPFYELRSR